MITRDEAKALLNSEELKQNQIKTLAVSNVAQH